MYEEEEEEKEKEEEEEEEEERVLQMWMMMKKKKKKWNSIRYDDISEPRAAWTALKMISSLAEELLAMVEVGGRNFDIHSLCVCLTDDESAEVRPIANCCLGFFLDWLL